MEIDPDVVEQSLYEQFASHLNDIMNLETRRIIHQQKNLQQKNIPKLINHSNFIRV